MIRALSTHRPSRGFTGEAIEHARRRYENTDETQHSIAADLGVHSKTLNRLARQQGWKLRKDRPPRDLPAALRLDLAATQALGETATDARSDQTIAGEPVKAPMAPTLALRLEQALEKELRKVESLRSQFGNPAHRSIEAERIARTLATLTETLFKVRRLRDQGPIAAGSDDDMPRDTDGFRRGLALRIDTFVRSRADGSVFGANEPSGATPAQS